MLKGWLAQCCHGGAWLALGAAGLGVLAVGRLVAIQIAPPPFVPTADVAPSPDDRLLLDSIGADAVVGIVTAPGWLATTTSRGAEIKELSVFLAENGYDSLKHEAPSVRALTAFYLLTRHPKDVRLLGPLLGDEGSLIQIIYEDPARSVTVGELVVDMACAVAPKSQVVSRFLARAGDDPRRLFARAKIAECLKTLSPELAMLPPNPAWKQAAAGIDGAAALLGFRLDTTWLATADWPAVLRTARAVSLDAVAVPASRGASGIRALLRELTPRSEGDHDDDDDDDDDGGHQRTNTAAPAT